MTTRPLTQNLRALRLKTAFVCATAVSSLAMLAAPANAGWRGAVGSKAEAVTRPVGTETCVNTADEALQKIPSFSKLVQGLTDLPLTGAPIAETLLDPARRQQICLVKEIQGGAQGIYDTETKRVGLPEGSEGFDTALHESLHAHQDKNGAFVPAGTSIAPQDIGISHLLSEAAAQVYPLLVAGESRLQYPDAYLKAVSKSNTKPDLSIIQRIFENALARTYAEQAHLDETARRALALQEAGRATVDAMVAGRYPEWNSAYRSDIITSMNAGDADAPTQSRRYLSQRDELLRRAGMISARINITPTRFLGPGADAAIKQAMADNGIETFSVPKPTFIFGQGR